ncbi:Ig-like domain-containing protein [Paenibacillus methanolicus]|uniref:Ig-like protein group 2 n=1 Tax=Paenibacillus methanolicus TaxID=582686 RepID=A0A5S5C8N0_9BACL|nr:Ig-like domain-containing protein [Paenibacillus methanolicus]TYP75694.1 Ig-like protein group 2 [Paenibacillus methanolicus]
MRKTDKQGKTRFSSRSTVSALLAFVMMLTLMSGMASAADETVKDLQFEDSYPTTMYVSNGTMTLNVLATVSSSTTKKDVTSSATWTSSNPAVIKVSGGTLTALTTGTAKISAQYSGFKVSLDMTSEYMYDSVTIKQNGSAASDSLNLNIGDDLEFTLTATKGGTTTDNIADATWTSSDASVASVDDEGIVTLTAAGTATITASYKGRKDTVKLTVASPYKELKIDGDSIREFKVGEAAVQLVATATKTSGGTENVEDDATWTTSSAGVVTVEDGKITPVAPGKATVTATHLGVSASVTVVVRPAFEAMRISPTDTQHILINGNDVQFEVSIPDNNNWKDVSADATWVSSDIYTATVDKSGKVTPKEIGSTTISATYKGLVKSVLVHVYPTINTMKAAKETVDAFVDEAVALPVIKATSLADEEFDADDLVTWTTTDSTIVDLKEDKWIGKKVGEAKMIAAIGDKSVEVTVKVSEKPLVLTSENTNLSLVIGKEADLPTIKVINESGTEEEVTSKVTWKASSANLLLKAPKMKGLVKSNVNLTASYLGKSITFKVTIEEELTKLFIDASNVTLTIGKTKAFKVTGVYKSGQTVTLSTKMNWSLNSETIATVNSNIVKGLTEGTVTLTGTYQSKTVTATIAVKPKLLKLVVSEKSFTMAPGSAKTFKVTAQYENGKSVDVTKTAVWTSSKTATAGVSDGTVVALAKGAATIKVAYEGKTATIRVTVKP